MDETYYNSISDLPLSDTVTFIKDGEETVYRLYITVIEAIQLIKDGYTPIPF